MNLALKDNAKMEIKFVTLLFICLSTVLASAMSQEELDQIVADEVLMFEHDEDADAVIQHLIATKGVARRQLAESFSKVVRRTVDAPIGSVSGIVCHGAICYLGEYADESQLTNLVHVALVATNANAAAALQAYHDRKRGTSDFVDLAERFLKRQNLSGRDKTPVWYALTEDMANDRSLAGNAKVKILRIATDRISVIDEQTPYADDLLVRFEPGYARSAKRLKMVTELLETCKEHPRSAVLRQKYQKVVRLFGVDAK